MNEFRKSHLSFSFKLFLMILSYISLPSNSYSSDLDLSFEVSNSFPIAGDIVKKILVQDDGKIHWSTTDIITGNMVFAGTSGRLEANGNDDESYARAVKVNYNEAILQSDGKLLIVDSELSRSFPLKNNLTRVNTDGTIDASFDSTIVNVGSIALLADDKTLVSSSGSCIKKLNENGSIDLTFNVLEGFSCGKPTVQPDGKIIIIGDSASTQLGEGERQLIRLNSDGTLDDSFSVLIQPGETIKFPSLNTMLVQTDGKVIVGGHFEFVNGVERKNIVRINNDGSIDDSFNPGIVGPEMLQTRVRAIVIQEDGKIVVGGKFTSAAGVPINNVVRLNSVGEADSSFKPNPNGEVYDIAIDFDEKIIIAGDFFTVSGVRRRSIARIEKTSKPEVDDSLCFPVVSSNSNVAQICL